VVGDRQGHVALGAQLVGRRHLRHRVLVIEAVLGELERRLEAEDRLALLERGDPARREGGAVAQAIDLIDDRPLSRRRRA
jgi:hypothetical protein